MDDRPVGCARIRELGPLRPAGVVVPSVDRLPTDAPVVGTEQALWRGTRVPDTGLVDMPGRQPEHVVDGASVPVAGPEGGGPRRFAPGPSYIGGAEDRGPEMTGAGRDEEGRTVTRVEDRVLDDVAQEHRPARRPRRANPVGGQQPWAGAGQGLAAGRRAWARPRPAPTHRGRIRQPDRPPRRRIGPRSRSCTVPHRLGARYRLRYVHAMAVTEEPSSASTKQKERWTYQWKELFDEVITSGLCTGPR